MNPILCTSFDFFKTHCLYFLCCFVFFILVFGVVDTSGSKYLDLLFLFFISFSVFYILLFLVINRSTFLKRWVDFFQSFFDNRTLYNLSLFSMALIVALMFIHLLILGKNPMITSWQSIDYPYIVELRKSITGEHHFLWHYFSFFALKAVVPFFLIYSFTKHKRLIFFLFLAISLFYSISLLQKSYPFTILLPLIVYLTLGKKIIQAILFSALMAGVLVFMQFNSNPMLRSDHAIYYETVIVKNEDPGKTAVGGLLRRTLRVPGWVVSQWFEAVPDKLPYLDGCGYRWLARLKGCEFRNYSLELFPVFHPAYAARGLQGSVNTASFVYDYANWGKKGLVLAGFLLAFVLTIVNLVFKGDFKHRMALNTSFILFLSSSSLTTMFFSGGWGLMIFLYLFFGKSLQQNSK